jgi:hypothetical protein
VGAGRGRQGVLRRARQVDAHRVRHDSDELSLKLARMFATATGAEVLAWMHEHDFALTPEWIDRALARARTLWSTGGPVSDAGGSRNSR